jgi:hypothetical protein
MTCLTAARCGNGRFADFIPRYIERRRERERMLGSYDRA